MRVITTAIGFYGGSRRRIGDEFDFDLEEHGNVPFKKDEDGNFVLVENKSTKRMEQVRDTKAKRELPKWLVPASDDARAKVAEDRKTAAKRESDAAVAAFGPKRAKPGFANADELV